MIVKHRNFNKINISKDQKEITKESSQSLEGEIYYYQNISKDVGHMFPNMREYSEDKKRYTMEYIQGHTFSELFVSEQLDVKYFEKMLTNLKSIHEIKPGEEEQKEIDIYANYVAKIKKRYDPEYFENFEKSEEIYKNLCTWLLQYQTKNMGSIGMIHGDPVFTNVVLDSAGSVMFIDMKGKLNETNSIYGDVMYDWAKVYQSLIGYDAIIHDRTPKKEYVSEFMEKFWYYCPFDKEDVRMITRSLIFTLLPLHSEKQQELYSLLKV